MTGENVNPIPNILTLIRLVFGVLIFILLAGMAGGIPFLNPTSEDLPHMQRWGIYVFVIAALTDLFDGFLARQLHAESQWGAILDPIADKILVCGTILGVFAIHSGDPYFALPAAVILFREFAVAGLRETAAAKGIKVPVSFMGKIKTTAQLIGLGMLLFADSWSSFNFDPNGSSLVFAIAYALVWLSAFISLWSGIAYFMAARKAL